jgi:hypothetical protein
VVTPDRVSVRAYGVGFGDALLVGFHYPRGARWVLVDLGSSALPRSRPEGHLVRIAGDVRAACGGKLTAVVATHRHRDHVSGFAGPAGEIIAACRPDLVVQPWPEDPRAAPDARAATGRGGYGVADRRFVASLDDMQRLAEATAARALRVSTSMGATLRGQLRFLGEANARNAPAMEALRRLAPNEYVRAGSRSRLAALLPGVKVRVLGPPTLEQWGAVEAQRARDAGEYWHLAARTAARFAPRAAPPFPPRRRLAQPPPGHRWLVERLRHVEAEELLRVVRILDDVLNNTSVILLLEVDRLKLLLPGDAQWESWAYTLEGPGRSRALDAALADVRLYKVGHHGSLNATPKSLWRRFARRSTREREGRLATVLSTMGGKHGDFWRGTEVPRRALVEALERESRLVNTQRIRGKRLYEEVVLEAG